MSKKSHHFLTLWPSPLTYDLEKLIRSGHYHYQCVYQIWEQSIPWFLSYRVNTIAGGGRRAAGGGRRAAGGGRRAAGGGRRAAGGGRRAAGGGRRAAGGGRRAAGGGRRAAGGFDVKP